MTVGSQDDKKMNKPPFTLFGELTSAGVQVGSRSSALYTVLPCVAPM